MGISPIQLAIVLMVILLLFGNRLPLLARSLGSSLIEFKKGVKEADEAPVVHHSETNNT
jgi:TatA/E family protein of Tat protein translocase